MENQVRKEWLVLFAAGAGVVAVLASKACRSAPPGPPARASAQDERGPSPPSRSTRASSPEASASPPADLGPRGRAPAASAPSGGSVVVSSTWGSEKDQLGHARPMEGNPEGPMSFTLDPKGRVLVLDQVNGRVVRY